jgi:hypothetical protein
MSVKTLQVSSLVLGLAAAVTCLTGAAPAQAMVIFDNTNSLTGTSFNSGGLVSGSNSYVPVNLSIGFQFQASAGGTLSQIDINLKQHQGSGDITFELFSDNSNTLGSALSSFNLNPPLDLAPQYYSITSFSVTPTLTAGTNYWLVASTETRSNNLFDWFQTESGSPLQGYVSTNNNPSYSIVQPGLFRVSVNSNTPSTGVPVPPQFVATAIGAGIGALKLRRQKAVA